MRDVQTRDLAILEPEREGAQDRTAREMAGHPGADFGDTVRLGYLERLDDVLIVAEGFDLGVRVADLVPSDMIAVSLGRPQRYAVVGSPAYFEKHGRPRVPPDLLKHQCIRVRLPNGALYRWEFEKGGQIAQIDVTGPITLDEASLVRTAVLEGLGLGFFMEQNVLADIEAKRLVRVLEDWTRPFAGLCLYYPGRRNPSAALKAFIGLARKLSSKSGS